jgi:hypothetical protein
MTIGGSLLLVAIGAILRYATNLHVKGIDIDTVGLILMIVGAIGFVVALIYEVVALGERSRYSKYWARERTVPRERALPPDEAPTRRYE